MTTVYGGADQAEVLRLSYTMREDDKDFTVAVVSFPVQETGARLSTAEVSIKVQGCHVNEADYPFLIEMARKKLTGDKPNGKAN